MNTMLRVAALAGLLLPLGACLVMPYEPPTSGPMADIRIENQSGRYLALSFYEDSLECRERHNLLPVIKAGQIRDLKMIGGRPTTLTLSQDVGPTMGCLLTFTFDAVENHRYEIVMPTTCLASIADVTTGKPVPVSYEKRTWKRPFDEHGPFCEPR